MASGWVDICTSFRVREVQSTQGSQLCWYTQKYNAKMHKEEITTICVCGMVSV